MNRGSYAKKLKNTSKDTMKMVEIERKPPKNQPTNVALKKISR